MRSLVLFAAVVGVCGCGHSGAKPDATDAQASSSSAAGAASQQPASYLERVESFHSLDPEIQSELHKAEALIGQGKLGVAIEVLSRLIGEHPKTALAFAMRAQANSNVRHDADAFADYSTAIELEPKNSEHYVGRGYFLLTHGNTTKAIVDFEQAIALRPQDPQAYNHRGTARIATGEVKRAIEDFNKAIELDPKFVSAYNNRSLAYTKADRRKEAMADLDRALEINPNVAATRNNRGILREQNHEYDKALADFSEAVRLDPTNASYYNNRRQVYLRLKRYPEAQADAARVERLMQLVALNNAVFRDPRSPKPYIDRGVFLRDEGEFEGAIVNFTHALELDPKQWLAYTERARAWIRRGEFKKAVDDCDAALAIEQRDDAYGVRGDAYRKLGDYAKAVADYDSSQRFDREVGETWLQYSKSLRQAGRGPEADQALKKANEFTALNGPSGN